MHKPRHYTVELEAPGAGWTDLQEATARARRAAEEMRSKGTHIRFLRSIFVPEEDACFFLFEGYSARFVRIAATRAELGVRGVRAAMRLEPDEREGSWT
jgi:hypothetical protein